MTKTKHTVQERARKAEAVRAEALRRWNRRVWAAYKEYENDVASLLREERYAGLQFTDVPADEEERTARDITVFISTLVMRALEKANGHEFLALSDQDAATLVDVRNRLRSPVYGKESAAVTLAIRIVREHVEGHRYVLTGMTPADADADPFVVPGRNSEEIVYSLVMSMANLVHPGFKELCDRQGEVRGILERYEPDRRRRRRPRGTPSGLGLDGILRELNELCGRPLGSKAGSLSTSAIGNKRRAAAKD